VEALERRIVKERWIEVYYPFPKGGENLRKERGSQGFSNHLLNLCTHFSGFVIYGPFWK
jgi:hypothetical protein